MIVKKLILTLIISICLSKVASGTSFSKVFVESETSPTRYYEYGAPYGYASIAGPKYSQINTLPASAPTYVNSCLPPCVVTGQALTAVNPASNILTYNSPYATIPVVVGSAKEEPTGYQYSYAVYDENTGDHKAQRELSDGSVVRGQYSFIQPDGYIREVQYVADDIKGFNAVVKNFLPAALESKNSVKKEQSEPCLDVTKESLKETPGQDNNHDRKLANVHDTEHGQELHDDQGHQISLVSNQNTVEPIHEPDQGHSSDSEHSDGSDHDHDANQVHNESEHSVETGHEPEAEHVPQHDHDFEPSNDHTLDHGEGKNIEQNLAQKDVLEHSLEKPKENPTETVHISITEGHSTNPKESAENNYKQKNKSKTESKVISIEIDSEEDARETIILHPKVHELMNPKQKEVVAYHDVIRCIQAALKKSYGNPAALIEEPSPLTYIVLNKPC